MVKLQTGLEHACFEFGERKMPQTLRYRGWDCVEKVELNHWMDEFARQREIFDTGSFRERLSNHFTSAAAIRDVTVHRTHITTSETIQLLLGGERLVRLLEVNEYISVIRTLTVEAERITGALLQNSRSIMTSGENKLFKIEAERSRLQRLEDEAKEETSEGVKSC